MSENGEKAEWFLPLAGPKPEGCFIPPGVMFASGKGTFHNQTVRVLGPPIHRDTLAAPLSAEARAVLEAAARIKQPGDGPWMVLFERAHDYARSIAPPDPLAEAREALAQIRASRAPDFCGDAVDRLETALAKLGEKP